MRIVVLTCKSCGNETEVEILTQAEEADSQIPRSPVKCPRCGSRNVTVHA